MAAITGYNPFAPDVKENPYPFYDWLRREHPIYHNEEHDIWAISRYEDVVAAARTPEIFSSAKGIGPDKVAGVPMMITQDPPVHTRLRALVSKAFTPRTVAGMEPRIRAITHALIDAVIDRGRFDLVQDVAYPLPVIVIAEMLGVEPEQRDQFKRWSDDVIDLFNGSLTGDAMTKYLRTWNEFKDYFGRKIEERRQTPRADLITALVQAQEERDALTMSEMLNFCLLLLVAGNETTTNLIGNGAAAIFGHPDQAEKLRRSPALINSMVEEALRYDGPIQGTFRTTTRAYAAHGVTIPADRKVLLLWGAANRDPDKFPAPDRFDIERTPNQHIAFGIGIHVCLGGPLARLEAQVATRVILERMRNIRVDESGARDRVDNPLFRGYKRLPLLFDAA